MLRLFFLPLLLLSFTLNSFAQSLTLLGHLSYGSSTCGGLWHYVDSLSNEYALVTASDKISIVNVTDPALPVEVFSVPADSGQNSLWREIKTYNKHAYSVSQGGGGVIIIDLSALPDTVTYTHWYGDGIISNQLQKAHTIAATDGYIYVFGSTAAMGGCIIADISDPVNPHFTGMYTQHYVHDGYIRNDTLWAAEIQNGQFSIIDVSDKTNPVLLNTQSTPSQACHNVWLSDNSNYAFTTDEITGAPLSAFDVTDINNIALQSTYYTDSLPNKEVHNVRVLNDYLINPSYGDQLTIVDAARPGNLIEIGHATTHTAGANSYLCWDASPYLPSGIIVASDLNSGLFIFQPAYHRACYLEGTATDSISGLPLSNVTVEILSTPKTTVTGLTGNYKTGVADSGTFDIHFSASGYFPKTYAGISLTNGVLTTLNAQLVSTTSGIEDMQLMSSIFEAYPNPFSESFLLRSDAAFITSSTFVRMLDITGRIVYEQKITASESIINLPPWIKPGTYLAEIVNATSDVQPIILVRN
jgi:choice-of-anchor B domain-containing protein